VSHFGTGAERTVFHFAEVPHMGALTEMGTLAQMAKRTDIALIVHNGVLEHRGSDAAAVADGAAFDHCIGSDDTLCANGGGPAQGRVGVDNRILPERDLCIDVGGGRIKKGNAF